MREGAEVRNRDYHWQLIKLLMSGEKLSALDMSNAVGCNRSNADRMVKLMRDYGLIYICGHEAIGTVLTRIYAWRDRGQEDAERPARMTHSDRCQKYRQTKRVLSGEVRIGIWGL